MAHSFTANTTQALLLEALIRKQSSTARSTMQSVSNEIEMRAPAMGGTSPKLAPAVAALLPPPALGSPLLTASTRLSPTLRATTSITSTPIQQASKQVVALDLDQGAPYMGNAPALRMNLSPDEEAAKVTLSVTIRQRRLKEINEEMELIKLQQQDLLKKKQQQQPPQQPPRDFSREIQSIHEQMKLMQEMHDRRYTTQQHHQQQQQQVEDCKPEATSSSVRVVEEEPAKKMPSNKPEPAEDVTTSTQEEETEHDDDSPLNQLAEAAAAMRPASPRSSPRGLKERFFGRRKSQTNNNTGLLSFSSMKKAYIAQIDQEITSMREELHQLQLLDKSGTDGSCSIIPEEAVSSSTTTRRRSGSPSWRNTGSLLRKKARNRSPDGR